MLSWFICGTSTWAYHATNNPPPATANLVVGECTRRATATPAVRRRRLVSRGRGTTPRPDTAEPFHSRTTAVLRAPCGRPLSPPYRYPPPTSLPPPPITTSSPHPTPLTTISPHPPPFLRPGPVAHLPPPFHHRLGAPHLPPRRLPVLIAPPFRHFLRVVPPAPLYLSPCPSPFPHSRLLSSPPPLPVLSPWRRRPQWRAPWVEGG